jgi:hypothetical protein
MWKWLLSFGAGVGVGWMLFGRPADTILDTLESQLKAAENRIIELKALRTQRLQNNQQLTLDEAKELDELEKKVPLLAGQIKARKEALAKRS